MPKITRANLSTFLYIGTHSLATCLWSERRELNPRPQAPQTCAIPLRYAPNMFKHYQRYLDAAGGQLPLRYAPIR